MKLIPLTLTQNVKKKCNSNAYVETLRSFFSLLLIMCFVLLTGEQYEKQQ